MNVPVKPQEFSASAPAILRCFGRFQVLAPDGTEIKWRTAKAQELLAFLAHHRGEAVDRMRIMDALWSHDPKNTSAYLNTTAYYLRGTLGNAGIADALEQRHGYYRIRMECFDSHMLAFEEAISTPGSLQQNALVIWEKGAGLYKGGYLAENNYDWSEQRRMLLEEGYVELILRMNKQYEEAGQLPVSIRLLKKAIRQVPWSEALHETLIHAYLGNRDRLGALKQYDALKRMLLREYSAEPGDEIKRLLHLLR
ncbi:MAG: hypothetical protein K0Q90_3925 [Paenibacillaceae bacterium]|nr:hypothetical protein [Paenibacillaceae bacterium]